MKSRAILAIGGVAICFIVAAEASQREDSSYSPTSSPLTTIDSLVTIGFHDSIGAPFARQFSIDRSELIESTPIQLPDNFFQFSLIDSESADSLIAQLSVLPGVRAVNPVIRGRDGSPMFATDAAFVRFATDALKESIDSLNAHFADSAEDYSHLMSGLYRVHGRIDSLTNVFDLMDLYRASGLCRWAEPDLVWTPILNSGDLFEHQWHFKNTGQHLGTLDADIDADSAWLLSRGSSHVRIAVIDAGFDFDIYTGVFLHEDTGNSRLIGYDVAGESNIDPVPDSNAAADCAGIGNCACGHGTECLGVLMAAHQHSGLGLKGLAPECSFVAIKALTDGGEGSNGLLAQALHYAWYTAGAKVVSLSLGPPGGDYELNLIADEILEMSQHGVFVVVAAGNKAGDVEPPANFSGAVAVGSTNNDDVVWGYSAHGNTLDFVAPSGAVGGCPISTGDFWTWDMMGDEGMVPSKVSPEGYCDPGEPNVDYFCRSGGTSMAAPQVAGVAALILSSRPDIDATSDPASAVYDVIKNSTEVLSESVPDPYYGWGRINAFRALLSVCRGNPTGDEHHDLADVAEVAHQASFSWPPLIHRKLSDLDCDGDVDADDVDAAIDIVFRDFDRPDPCFEFDH